MYAGNCKLLSSIELLPTSRHSINEPRASPAPIGSDAESSSRPTRLSALASGASFVRGQVDDSLPAASGAPRAPSDKVGVLLLNLGGPDKLEDVQPFLFNLFADPEIIRLPPQVRFLQPAIAQLISTLRAPKSQEGYKAIGGGKGHAWGVTCPGQPCMATCLTSSSCRSCMMAHPPCRFPTAADHRRSGLRADRVPPGQGSGGCKRLRGHAILASVHGGSDGAGGWERGALLRVVEGLSKRSDVIGKRYPHYTLVLAPQQQRTHRLTPTHPICRSRMMASAAWSSSRSILSSASRHPARPSVCWRGSSRVIR